MGASDQVAIFAGGCFWCVESDFEKLSGVSDAISGYTGGTLENPTYRQVGSGSTRHIEAVAVYYDPNIISYKTLVDAFWHFIDPTDDKGQFVDRGYQYRPAIFVHDSNQQQIAEQSRENLKKSDRFTKAIIVPIETEVYFWTAENYHQDYYKKNPLRYKYYRHNSGRDQFLEEAWGEDLQPKVIDTSQSRYHKPSNEELRKTLSALQYDITQNDDTEPAFSNQYWNEKRVGIYVDVVSGEPLFSSLDKYNSKTGWPSFTKPLKTKNIIEQTDYKLLYPRTELRSRYADSHLGHLFNDGPQPTGLRYCINSAALRFIPLEELENQGYSEFANLFAQTTTK